MKLEQVFGKVLRNQRKKVKQSQEFLALESGYSRTFISLLERGLRQPTLTTIFKLSLVLQISPSELVGLIEKEFQGNFSFLELPE